MKSTIAFSLVLAGAFITVAPSHAADPVVLPNGLSITPGAVPHAVELALNPRVPGKPNLNLSQPVTTVLSPDGTRLLTSGFNKERGVKGGATNEYVFVYDTTVFPPRQLQALPVANSFCGLAWNPNGREFYVSGGVDDKIYVFNRSARGTFRRAAEVKLGHARGNGLTSNLPAPLNANAPKPMTAGIAVNQSGSLAVVANFYNDSITVIDLKTRTVRREVDLRPGVQNAAQTGQPGGTYPYWVAIRGDETAYVSSPRDREVVAVNLNDSTVVGRVQVTGQPNRIVLNRAGDTLFAAVDNADAVAMVDLKTNQVVANIGTTAPESMLPSANLPKGANPNSLVLSADERTLYVTNGGTNSVAVIDVNARRVRGLMPTGWYPGSISLSADGKNFFVAVGKSMPGPNKGWCRGDVKAAPIPDCAKQPNSYVYNLEEGSLLAAPLPAPAELAALTQVVAENNHFDVVKTRGLNPTIAALRRSIQHVIYVVKENRTYDQVLGDLEIGNGDSTITEFPEPLSPNHHALARNFVTLDNFLDSGEVSGVGWNWTVAARTTDYTEKTVPTNYAGRGFEYDWEGFNRNINVGIASMPERIRQQPLLNLNGATPDLNLLVGPADVAAPDSAAGDPGSGYIWDEAIRAGLTVRNYGFFCDPSYYEKANPAYLPISNAPFAEQKRQAVPGTRSLQSITDPYYRSFDMNASDFYQYKEWEREFDGYVQNRNLPNLSLVRLAHDHFGSFGTAANGINTPGIQMADNDYALGLLVEKVARSPYASNTLIFVIEDDAQDGPDHMDAHRSIAYVLGPHVKQGAVVSHRYNTVSMVRTIEAILGLEPSSLYAAAAEPMTEVFDLNQTTWSYTPIVPDILRNSTLPLPARTAANSLPQTPSVVAFAKDRRDAAWWQRQLGDMDFEVEDKLDTDEFNRELWLGMMGNKPYPKARNGVDLRAQRVKFWRN
jgi:YVTN family beta-propeller protein